jgi:hypothetical protein
MAARKLRRIRRVYETESGGFTVWIQPIERGYLMACCDCGLVHEMDFRVDRGRAQFRARRRNGYTKRQRAKTKAR